ncbi:MAG: DUF4266 domain-containing protein [Bacteroidia bacterium]
MKTKYTLLAFAVIGLASCVAVKPHEMVYLNDEEMKLGNSMNKNFEIYIETIREGSTSAGSNKSSGGCGCN